MVPDVNEVETEGDYVHVRFRDPDRYEEIRTPDWADQAVRLVSEDAEVRTGREENRDDRELQGVLVDEHVGEEMAREQARGIVEKIRS